MKKLTTEELREKVKTLPTDLIDAVFSSDIAEILLAIGKKYGLLIDKVGELSSATNHVILGALHPREFIPTLEDVLKVDRETAKKIAQEVNTEIFAKIRESLRKVHKIEEPISASKPTIPESVPVKPPAPPSPPVFTTEKKISFADLKPAPPAVQQSAAGLPSIRPFQGGGVAVEVKKEPARPSEKVDVELEKEVESLLKVAVESKPKEEPKKFWQPSRVGWIKPEAQQSATSQQPTANREQPKPLVDVKIKAVEEGSSAPKMSPFGFKMQDGIFRSGPAEERKVFDDKPAVPKYGFSDPYREAPDEKERGGLSRAG